jgi:hypothetical protein
MNMSNVPTRNTEHLHGVTVFYGAIYMITTVSNSFVTNVLI